MRLTLKALALAAILLPGVAAAQVPQFPQNLPANTVVGRLGTGAGPSQAIPFATLFSKAFSATGVPNAVLGTDSSGNGRWSTTLPGTLTIPSPNLTGSISAPFGLNLPLFGGGSGSPIATGTTTGNTTRVVTAPAGSFTATNCAQWDASGNLTQNAAPCGTGNNVSYAQDFIAGTDFAAGTTTSLTVTNAPLSTQSTTVYFDGIRQSANTWSLAGSTVTFLAAIPANTKVVEIASLSTTALPTWVTSIGNATGAVTLGAGLSISGQALSANSGSVDNLLPNVQWQLWSGGPFITKQNAAGTAAQGGAGCSGFTTASLAPTLTCSNTQQIRANDIVIISNASFWGYAGAGFITCAQVACMNGQTTASRVVSVATNSSIGIQGNFNGSSPASSTAVTVTPIAPGDLGSSTNGPDGWTKSSTLIATVDDWGASATPASTVYPGCIRPLMLRKGVTGVELFQWAPSAKTLARYQGQTVSFGVVVYQRVQGGSGTWHIYVNDNVNPGGASGNGTGASLGGYQFLNVAHTIGQTASSVAVGISLDGNAGDVFDVCLPTAAFAPSIAQSQLKQNSGEVIRATSHWNPALLTPLIINFPTVQLVPSSGLYGWNNIDLEAISFGTVHNSVGNVYAKLEWTTATVGAIAFTGANVNVTNGLTFGLQASTQVANVMFSTNMGRWPLYHDGTVSIFTNVSGLVMGNGTFDFTDVDVWPPTSVNFLLKRDVDPASNDNDPMWLEKVA